MEVVAAPSISTGGTPFRDHDVREWSRINSITGALERARLETDSWSASTRDASHKYGKVVDSRARTGADGSLQAQASRQFEVFQSRAAGARLQVVKTKTVSSSRWSGKGEAGTHGLGFKDLQLPLNPLDLSFEKSKASLGRSVGRRPPTRQPRSQNLDILNDLHTNISNAHFTAAANLHRVSRLCHQVHESAVRNAFGEKSSPSSKRNSIDSSTSGVEITEIASSVNSNSDINLHSNLTRTKSTSSDDIHQIPEKDSNCRLTKDSNDLEQLQTWKRTSKIRRSLQYPKTSSPTLSSSKPIDLPKNTVSVKKIREDLEKGKRLTTALRNNSGSVDLDALDQIIQSISSSSSIEKSSVDDNLEDHESEYLTSKRNKKRDSFVTVKSLQEVRERLRRTGSPGSDFYSTESKSKDEDSDDGIVTEESNTKTSISNKTINQSKVKSYIYGMESMLENKKPVLGTGSLESRSKLVNGSASHKNEDWYNRRKSYGFEKVHGQEEPGSNSLKNKNVAESSTDSGICRSSEIMVVPMATKTNTNNRNISRFNSDSESDVDSSYNSHNKSQNGINYGNVKKMTSIFNQVDKNLYYNKSSDGLTNTRNKRPLTLKENEWKKSEIKSTTITIPIVKNNNVVDLAWNDELEKDLKRHSIAVDEAKYATNTTDNRFRKTSLVMNEQFLKNDNTTDDDNLNNKKPKKVLFCKTEVHFAADSGKVNIVETDEKPPPTQNFRRRRRNSGPITDLNENFNQNGFPVLHFGDSSYEKTMFGINDEEIENKDIATNSANIYENIQLKEPRVPSAFSVVTVNTNYNINHNSRDEERKDCAETDNIKGILKNKPNKPKPYHLGETAAQDSNSDEDSRKWGVRLRPVPKDNPPIWKSTVTVQNSYYDNQDETKQHYEQPITNQTEFRKLIRNLRPTKKPDYLSDNENRYSDSFANIRVVPAVKDNRRSSWSVADKIKLVDDVQESKLYSTKVNFGDGKAIVVENDQSTWPRMENLSKENLEAQKRQDVFTDLKKTNTTYNKYSIHSSNSKFSPVVLRKTIPITTEPRNTAKHESVNGKPKTVDCSSLIRNTESSIEVDDNRQSLTKEYKNIPDSTLQSKYINENIVLRQPKKSEMTYFGVNVSPKSSKRTVQTAVIKKERKTTEKSDLIQYHKRSSSPVNIKSRRRSPENNRNASTSPIYENLRHVPKTNQLKYSSSKDFDSSILDELTKAADQILQAVNGYTDEDCHNRLSSDEEEPKKPLDTISETKSWKNSAQNIDIKNQQRMRPTLASAAKVRVKRTSSTSSVESLSRDKRKSSLTERKTTASASKLASETSNKKVINDHSSAKASTKARRLQRASSREALLQSHGSSSEDLPTNIEAPVRKPRLVKKTKATQLTITNGMELKKPTKKSREEKSDNSKSSERMLGSLSEIRHKTAISTLTTPAEKCSRDKSRERSRDRSKTRGEESKGKMYTRRESSSKGTISSSSTRPTSSTSRGQQHHFQRATTSSKESGVTQHRISTANIKKCHRSEGASKH